MTEHITAGSGLTGTGDLSAHVLGAKFSECPACQELMRQRSPNTPMGRDEFERLKQQWQDKHAYLILSKTPTVTEVVAWTALGVALVAFIIAVMAYYGVKFS